jgi:hypothetical protein
MQDPEQNEREIILERQKPIEQILQEQNLANHELLKQLHELLRQLGAQNTIITCILLKVCESLKIDLTSFVKELEKERTKGGNTTPNTP